ncbi:hypothetical protein B0I22_0767 [Epilithonimonas xixisoli]|uniref:Uncharacterized protein n=2 Tax=Epilithonimonas xixisoli TaxID=1476462 RepID=A0A4R8IAQ1_9FLAO|nr:hypothetical protein B0I22_0767 [Epilithonimonas xixisoli]
MIENVFSIYLSLNRFKKLKQQMKKIFLLFCLIFIFSCKEKKEEVLNNPDFKIEAANRDSKIPDSSADKASC